MGGFIGKKQYESAAKEYVTITRYKEETPCNLFIATNKKSPSESSSNVEDAEKEYLNLRLLNDKIAKGF